MCRKKRTNFTILQFKKTYHKENKKKGDEVLKVKQKANSNRRVVDVENKNKRCDNHVKFYCPN